MELNWGTFLLETINFLVLVWILTRFLYRPVRRAIQARQDAIAKTLATADAQEKAAADAKQRYDARLADWESEKAALRQSFLADLEGERTKSEAALAEVLRNEHARAQAIEAQQAQALQRGYEEEALRAAALFCAKLLSRIASPEVEGRLVDAALEDMSSMSPKENRALTAALSNDREAVVTTRYPLSEVRRSSIETALRELLGPDVRIRFADDRALVAGLRVALGSMVLDANLAEELRFFTGIMNGHQ
ncbi:MAG TPA: F0F1 ATP synthase subunit delta [Candidatus Binatia bacterium]|nr:F0F1 ATP synthase subunit delta [Candidatus Binatia bacterium]